VLSVRSDVLSVQLVLSMCRKRQWLRSPRVTAGKAAALDSVWQQLQEKPCHAVVAGGQVEPGSRRRGTGRFRQIAANIRMPGAPYGPSLAQI